MNAIAHRTGQAPAIVNRLLSLTPEATDASLLAKLTDLCGSAISIETRNYFPDNGPTYSLPASVKATGTITPEQAKSCLRSIDASMTPAPQSILVEELVKLRAVTAKRTVDEASASVIAAAYAEALAAFPADIAVACLRKRRQWWPTLAELEADAKPMLASRKLLLVHFERIAAGKIMQEVASAPRGHRKVPFDWRKRAGVPEPEPTPVRAHEAPIEQNLTPVSVSQAIARMIGET